MNNNYVNNNYVNNNYVNNNYVINTAATLQNTSPLQHAGYPTADAMDEPEQRSSILPTLIRGVGATALAIAMYIFLMKGWQHGDDLSRYLMMLAHTIVLVAAGLLSGRWLHENKGARLLVVMALASIPANFAILGGFLYSQFQPNSLQDYPQFVTWSLESLPLALGVTTLALAILIPVAKLGFAVLARPLSTPLTTLFIASNAALLLPLRDSLTVSVLAIAIAMLHALFNAKSYRKNINSQTFEGILALLLQYLPIGVLFGRSFWLYPGSFFLTFSSTLVAYGIIRRLSLSVANNKTWAPLFDFAALITAMLTASFALEINNYTDALPHLITLPLCMLTAAAMLYDLSLRASFGNVAFRTIATLLASGYFIINLATMDNFISAQICLLGGVSLMYFGQYHKQRSLFASGVVMVIIALAYNLMQVYQSFNLGGWITLAILGIGLILLASWIEMRGEAIKPTIANWKARFTAWDY